MFSNKQQECVTKLHSVLISTTSKLSPEDRQTLTELAVDLDSAKTQSQAMKIAETIFRFLVTKGITDLFDD